MRQFDSLTFYAGANIKSTVSTRYSSKGSPLSAFPSKLGVTRCLTSPSTQSQQEKHSCFASWSQQSRITLLSIQIVFSPNQPKIRRSLLRQRSRRQVRKYSPFHQKNLLHRPLLTITQ